MRKYLKYFFLLACVFISQQIYSQTWPLSQQIKGNSDVRVFDIQVDINNDMYLTGVFKGSLYDSTSRGNFDIFLIKLDQDFQIVWYKTFGSTKRDHNPRFIIDKANNIFLAGSFQDSCIFENTYLKSKGLNDIFLLKSDSDGSIKWVKNIVSHPSNQLPSDITVDKDNNLIIIGSFIDSTEVNGIDYKLIGSNQFILKTDTSSATTIWFDNYYCSDNNTKLTSVSAFDDGYYFNGYFYDNIDINGTVVTSAYVGKSDLLLYKTDYDGNNPWIRRSYGDGNDVTGSITQDDYGNIYYTGYFNSTSLDADKNATEQMTTPLTNNGDFDIFILKYNKTGDLQWANSYGLAGRDYGININQNSDILYIGGYCSDSIIFNEDTLETLDINDWDLFLATLDLNGNVYNAAKIGNTDGIDLAQAMHVTDDSRAIITGFFESSTLNVGDSTYTNGGLYNGIVAKYYAPLSAAYTKIKHPTCNSNTDGELIVTPIFGEKPYSYSWTKNGFTISGLTDSTATGLSPGIYEVTISDALSNTDVVTHTLTEPNPFLFSPTITQVTTCFDSNEGEIDITVTGGTLPYDSYLWTQSDGGNGSSSTAEDQTGLSIGTYNVRVTDDNGCFDDTTIYITGPSDVDFSASSIVNYTGFDPVNTGAIDLEMTGGTGTPATYGVAWTGPSSYSATTQDIVGIAAGAYTVTATDDNGCDFIKIFNVLDNDNFDAYISSSKEACLGVSNGNATAGFYSPDGNTAVSYSWNDPSGQTTATATNLAPGRYYVVTVTDSLIPANNDKDSVYITELTYNFAGSLSGTTDLDCKGDTDGIIDLTITTAGTLPYTYSWSNAETTQDILDLTADTYSVTVTDANECTFSITNYTISEPTHDVSASASIVLEPLCNGELNGSVRVDATGGSDVFTYLWDDPGNQTSQIATGLEANTYNVTVFDSNGCSIGTSIVLTEPTALSVSGSITNINCFGDDDGSILLTVGGGTPTYSYAWTTSDGDGLVPSDKNQSGLSEGTYDLTVSDGNSCEVVTSYNITEATEIEITSEVVTDYVCYGVVNGAINVDAIGGTGTLTYSIDGGTNYFSGNGDFSGLTSGDYTIMVKDDNDCVVSSNLLTVSEPLELVIDTAIVTDISCFGLTNGEIEITASGGTGTIMYSIDDGATYQVSNLFMGLAAGTNYQIKVQDVNLCETTGSTLTINEPTVINIDSEISTNISCFGSNDGEIEITASGGTGAYQYSIDDGTTYQVSNTFIDLAPGTNYQVKVRDINLCEIASTLLTINEPTDIISTDTTLVDNICFGESTGSVELLATGGTGLLTYTFSVGDVNNTTGLFEDLIASDYTITVSDENSCSKNYGPFTITEPTGIVSTDTTIVDNICFGESTGSVELLATGGTGLLTYTLSVGDISNTTGLFEDLIASDYTVTVSDENSCSKDFGPFTITEPTGISIDEVISVDLSCFESNDGQLAITATGGTGLLEYSIDNGTTFFDNAGVFSGLLSGTDYILVVKDANDCSTTGETYNLLEPEQIVISEENVTDISCHGLTDGAIEIIATGGTGELNYSINAGTTYLATNTFVDLIKASDYIVSVKDENDCIVAGSTLEIVEPDNLLISDELITQITCYGSQDGIIEITASGGNIPYSFMLNEETETTENIFTNLAPGIYTIQLNDANNCGPSISNELEIIDPDTISFTDISITNVGAEQAGEIMVNATGGTGLLTYTLIPGDLSNESGIFAELNEGIYTITVTDENQCENLRVVTINLLDRVLDVIYSAFTPNGDGYNDTWKIPEIENYPNCIVKIFNSWGTLIFESVGYNEPWDGNNNGNQIPAGVYYYLIDLGEGHTYSGTITLIK